MVKRAKMPCKKNGCGALVEIGVGWCERHLSGRVTEYERTRPTARQRGYSVAWEKARLGYLRKHPLCVACLSRGLVVPGAHVDHIVDHKGDRGVFWDSGNWQTLCASCHSQKTRRENGGGGR
jgi:5-methylcytosine-specific restriction protein A